MEVVARLEAQSRTRGLLLLAAPLILGAAAQSLLHFTDRVFIARLGLDATAAGFTAGMLAWMCQCLVIAAAAFAATVAAQHRGAGESGRCGPGVWPALWVAVFGGLLCLAAIPLLPWTVDRLLDVEPGVRRGVVVLTSWFLACTIPAALLAAIGGFFAGTGRTWVVLVANLVLLGVNALLQWVLIFGHLGCPALGLWGSGLGSFLANLLAAAGLAIAFLRRSEDAAWGTRRGWRPEWGRLARFCRFALPQALRQFAEMVLWTAFVFLVAHFGAAALAANNILLTWNVIIYMPMAGLSQAVSVAVGAACGANRPDLARCAFWRGLRLELVYGLGVAAAIILGADLLLAPFLVDGDGVTAAEVAPIAHQMIWVCAAYVLADALNMAYTGALNGAGDTRGQLLVVLATVPLFLGVPVGVVLWLGGDWWISYGVQPAAALWFASVLALVALIVGLAWRWHGGGWRNLSADLRATAR